MQKQPRYWGTPNGLFIIPELLDEWYAGKLTANEMLFLAEIENFAKRSKSKKGIWSSNKKLAICEGCNVRNIQKRLQKLSDEGYLKITIKILKNGKERRYIKTCWSDANRKAFEKRKSK